MNCFIHQIKKRKINFQSQKGDAIVLLSIIVTGIVMLISVIAIENLRKSIELQGVQKKSLDSLYKAEEGIEYGLYVNKEKQEEATDNLPFYISMWENGVVKKGLQALEQLLQPTEGRNIVITSESSNDNQAPKRTVFSNLPNKYYGQVPLWNILEGCGDNGQDCDITYEDNDIKDPTVYQVVVPSAMYENSSWDNDKTVYSLSFKCGGKEYWEENGPGIDCTLKNVKLEVTGCDVSTCKIEGCSKTIPIKFNNGEDQITGKSISTEWFKIADPGTGQPINLTNEKIVIEFELVSGSMEEAEFNGSSNTDILMCKQNSDGTWRDFRDRRGGLSSMDIRLVESYSQVPGTGYVCCGHEQICTQWEQVCDAWQQVCCGGYTGYICNGFAQNNSLCNSGNVGGCCKSTTDSCGGTTCNNYCQASSCTQACPNASNCCMSDGCGGCAKTCDQACQSWCNGNCTHYHDGNCLNYRSGNCNRWEPNSCN